MAGGLVLAAALMFAGCSRSGSLSGNVSVRAASGEAARGDRISVYLVQESAAFEREWAETVAAFRRAVGPAVEAQRGAEHQAEEARLAWDRAVAAGNRAGGRRGRWTLTLQPSGSAGSRERWQHVRATERREFQARKRVWEIVREYEAQVHALVEKHAAQRVQTDETGHYLLVKVPPGSAYVYARMTESKRDFVWFVPIHVQPGMQRADLTQDNQRRWALVP